jgi:hypothetical protein
MTNEAKCRHQLYLDKDISEKLQAPAAKPAPPSRHSRRCCASLADQAGHPGTRRPMTRQLVDIGPEARRNDKDAHRSTHSTTKMKTEIGI